ncbi:MAG: hypothetical protein ACLFSI_07950 [Halorhodospira sp.]
MAQRADLQRGRRLEVGLDTSAPPAAVIHRNPDFVEQVEAALEAKGFDRSATVITMCRWGSDRGQPSADYLLEEGVESVRYVTHGFQGDPVEGANARVCGSSTVGRIAGCRGAGPWTRTRSSADPGERRMAVRPASGQ